MSNLMKGDDVNIDRLSSFLQKQGMLNVMLVSTIQNHVFYLEPFKGHSLILKRHRNRARLEQQWRFFAQQTSSVIIPFQRFPNQKPYLTDDSHYWTITPYIPGKKLNYHFAGDRESGLLALQTFHHDTKRIKVSSPLRQEIFYRRWSKRLQKFRNTAPLFQEYGFGALFNDIVQTTEKHLSLITGFDWAGLERSALQSGTWIHGDVAAHNFIRYKGRVYMIDFDLLGCASPLHDYIQLGQRFLPYLNWDSERLLSYNMVQEKYLRPWLYALFIPSDVMRDWLYYMNRRSIQPVGDYLEKMEREWIQRLSFLKTAIDMLN
ncbi:phosphotransferase [Lentibacillus salinarum]|uniref:Phosphotransferase n=1 Tax=Lentibacillus salinarum TaxID=446820 RepID=A0ABW3ZWY3_9BACI